MRNLYRTLRTALRALRRNPMRSGLTTLGIVIGVAAVIAMTEIGQGTTTLVQRTIQNMGATNLLIQPGTATSAGVTTGSGTGVTLTPQDAEAIARECSTITAVAPMVRARTQVIYGNKNWVPVYIYGTTPDYLEVRDWQDLAEGEVFTDRDIKGGAMICMLGQTLVRELFPFESPIGKEVRVQNVPLKVIGVLKRKGASMTGLDQDDILLAPWTTIKNRISGSSLQSVNQSVAVSPTDPTQKPVGPGALFPGSQLSLYPVPSPSQQLDTPQPVRFVNIDQILVRVASIEEMPLAIEQITELLAERHRMKPGEPNDFSIRDMSDLTKSLGTTTQNNMRLVFFVAVVSLVVGGVGIMNIMLVSVTERTREIGLRMAVGARSRDILRQFLVESIVLCLLGGCAGILLGRGAAILVHLTLNYPTELSPASIAAAFGVSVLVGLVFGFYPAWKASRLDPIEALRYE